MIVQFIDYLRSRLRPLTYLFWGIVAGVGVWSLTVDKHHAHTWAEMYIPIFWGLFALASAVAIIFFSLWLGKAGIEIREDYYDD